MVLKELFDFFASMFSIYREIMWFWWIHDNELGFQVIREMCVYDNKFLFDNISVFLTKNFK